MRLAAYVRSLRALLFDPSRTEAEINEEQRSHIELRADDLERSGIDRAEAERRARIEFGGRERYKEEARAELGGSSLDGIIKDARYSFRALRKSPGFAIVAIVTLAVAIGANAVVFGVLNGLILRPLDVPQPESLWGIEHGNEHNMYESYPDYRDLRDRNHSFDGLAGFEIEQVGMDAGDHPTHAWVYQVTGNFFDELRLQPYIGRFFHASDERGPNSAPYVVLGHAYWQNNFQSDPGVLGRTIRVNKHPFTIVGVAPPGFRGVLVFGVADFFVPMANQEQIKGVSTLEARRTSAVFMSFGHLNPGVTRQQAIADLNSVGSWLEKTYPNDHGATTFVLARPNLYGNLMGGPMRAFITALTALAGLILLAACANLGSLFAARASDRRKEVALRLALGATRMRVLRQLLTEAMMISLAGGVVGLWGSVASLSALSQWQPFPRLPISVPVSPDARVYAIALVLAIASGLLFGIVPVRQVLRTNAYQVIKEGAIGAPGRMTFREALLAVQIAICALLVTSSFVAVRGLARALHSNFGFEPRDVLLAQANLSMAGYRQDQSAAIEKRMIESVAGLPGVQAVGLIGRPPLNGGGFVSAIFNAQSGDLRPSSSVFRANRFHISPDYFRAAETALLAGRDFSWHDDQNAPGVAIINREFARRLFGSAAQAVLSEFKLGTGKRIQVIGVVEDGKYSSLTEDTEPALFLPISQASMNEMTLVIRCRRDPRQLADAIRATIRGIDSGLPVLMESWHEQLKLAMFPAQIATLSLGVLGAMGAILAFTGTFGMAAFSVSRRLKELGIRMALGAQRNEVLRAALGRALQLLAFGSAGGLILGLLAARVLASIVYQATPRDPLVFAGVVLSMSLLGLLATWVPAQRALSLDPLTLLREE